MANPAILCLLATFSLFSGCLGEGSVDVDVDDPAPAGTNEGRSVQVDAAPAPLTPPPCPEGGQNNYGTWVQAGDEYVVSPYSGNAVVYYKESNGCNGLQSEEEWAHNPDTKVAELPYPILDGTVPSAKA